MNQPLSQMLTENMKRIPIFDIKQAIVSEPDGKQTSYTYDGAWNRLEETVLNGNSSKITTYEVDEQNRLVKTIQTDAQRTAEVQYYYDPAGNVVSKVPSIVENQGTGGTVISLTQLGSGEAEQHKEAIFRYNDRNQMVWAQTGTQPLENKFSADGYRSKKTVVNEVTHYLYDGDKIIKELDGNDVATYNVYGLSLISRETDGEKMLYLYNGHGDVSSLVSSAGDILTQYDYDAFGNPIEETTVVDNPFRYSGYRYDKETELYDVKSRFYDL